MKQIFLDILNQLNSVSTAWSSSVKYCAGQYVLYNGVTYRSTADGNTGNAPGTDINDTTLPYWVAMPFFTGTGGVQLTPFIAVWNNQVEQLSKGTSYNFQMPAIFIEFVTNEVIVLGSGVESFDPLDIKIHIVDDMIDAGDGTQDQNLRIFEFKHQVYTLLKQFKPSHCVPLFRVNEKQDYDHNNLYHYIQTYRTNYIDNSMQTPVGKIIYTYPPEEKPLTFTIEPSYAG